jgi:dolichol-phosphate mannosyltransferase
LITNSLRQNGLVARSDQHSCLSSSRIRGAFLSIIIFSFLLRLFGIFFNDLLPEEAYYWNYAQHLDFSYLDHPPMVAYLIKLSTMIFGTNEFGVRFPSLVCWCLTAYFSFKLTNLLRPGAGLYSVLFLSILPFFFLQSLVITPDQPLMVSWSASLYYLYRALVKEESSCWYLAGIWIGLGLLSKYTIVLLGPITLLYISCIPTARFWFYKKEPYLSCLIAIVLFTPVVYWNATHDWVSFAFQGTRRLHSAFYFSTPEWLGLILLFLTPLGVWNLMLLLIPKLAGLDRVKKNSLRFLQLFTLAPLVFFGVYSLTHAIKFNWIGPGLLALIPWLALLMADPPRMRWSNLRTGWVITATLLLITYLVMLAGVTLSVPEPLHRTLFNKFIDWEDLTRQVFGQARQIELDLNSAPIIVPLDLYNLPSELSFYQAKLLAQPNRMTGYPVIGCHIFGGLSLMYQFWSQGMDFSGRTVLLVSSRLDKLDNPEIKRLTSEITHVSMLWSRSQGFAIRAKPYFYKVVRMKSS